MGRKWLLSSVLPSLNDTVPAPVDERRILDAALSVWREHGYRDATTRKVAALAGVGEVTLFRRFGDKAALFGAALATEAQQFRADIIFSDDVEADLCALVAAYQAMLARNGAIVLDFLIEAPRIPELARIGPVPMAAIAAAASLIAAHQQAGRLPVVQPQLAVMTLLAPLILGHALGRAQPMLSVEIEPRGIVTRFLRGWQAGAV